MKRRALLRAGPALIAAGLPFPFDLFAADRAATPRRYLGERQPFDYAALKGRAQALAREAYAPRTQSLPEAVAKLDWDQYQSMRFHDDHLLWRDDKLRFEAAFFHLGLYFKSPVRIHELIDGQAQELAYDPAMFDYGDSKLSGAKLPRDLGFAGFRLNFHTDRTRDIAAFLGASYFRAVGGNWQYGLSARGLALDCGMEKAEEFPDFVAFWLERPAPEATRITIYALLDSPSITGAYRFDITPAATLTMDVDAAVYPRTAVERLGVAPLTSMFQCGENDRRMANDWRPEIHDSDGLAMWNGSGEWIWRPLTDPRNRQFNVYVGENPRGFGLLQRDRNFDHYQDDGVFYELRPSLWVEPRAGWGRGSVQLVELPTRDETLDNIVAFWCPEKTPQAGDELLYSYRLHWGVQMPFQPTLAQVVATRCGVGGVVGRKRSYYSARFAVDFAGGDLSLLGKDAKIKPVITASRGSVEITSARPLKQIDGYRALFDWVPWVPGDDSEQPVDIRMYLSVDGQPFSETWLYQWSPPPAGERHLVE